MVYKETLARNSYSCAGALTWVRVSEAVSAAISAEETEAALTSTYPFSFGFGASENPMVSFQSRRFLMTKFAGRRSSKPRSRPTLAAA